MRQWRIAQYIQLTSKKLDSSFIAAFKYASPFVQLAFRSNIYKTGTCSCLTYLVYSWENLVQNIWTNMLLSIYDMKCSITIITLDMDITVFDASRASVPRCNLSSVLYFRKVVEKGSINLVQQSDLADGRNILSDGQHPLSSFFKSNTSLRKIYPIWFICMSFSPWEAKSLQKKVTWNMSLQWREENESPHLSYKVCSRKANGRKWMERSKWGTREASHTLVTYSDWEVVCTQRRGPSKSQKGWEGLIKPYKDDLNG